MYLHPAGKAGQAPAADGIFLWLPGRHYHGVRMNTEQELEKYRATASSVCKGCLFEPPRRAAVLPAWPAAATSFDHGQAWPQALLVLISLLPFGSTVWKQASWRYYRRCDNTVIVHAARHFSYQVKVYRVIVYIYNFNVMITLRVKFKYIFRT